VGMSVSVGVGVLVGVLVEDEVGVGVKVGLGVEDMLGVYVAVRLAVDEGVKVKVGVCDEVPVKVGVMLAVAVGVGSGGLNARMMPPTQEAEADVFGKPGKHGVMITHGKPGKKWKEGMAIPSQDSASRSQLMPRTEITEKFHLRPQPGKGDRPVIQGDKGGWFFGWERDAVGCISLTSGCLPLPALLVEPGLHGCDTTRLVAAGGINLDIKPGGSFFEELEQPRDSIVGDDIRPLPAARIGMADAIEIQT
jgi:hypothetical protein